MKEKVHRVFICRSFNTPLLPISSTVSSIMTLPSLPHAFSIYWACFQLSFSHFLTVVLLFLSYSARISAGTDFLRLSEMSCPVTFDMSLSRLSFPRTLIPFLPNVYRPRPFLRIYLWSHMTESLFQALHSVMPMLNTKSAAVTGLFSLDIKLKMRYFVTL